MVFVAQWLCGCCTAVRLWLSSYSKLRNSEHRALIRSRTLNLKIQTPTSSKQATPTATVLALGNIKRPSTSQLPNIQGPLNSPSELTVPPPSTQ